jgi:hypothetical protein
MATLGDLKTRIISETTRDDLIDDMASDLNTIIAGAIDQYAAERWWFNELRATTACVIGDAFPAIPAGARIIDEVFLIVGGVRYPLTRRQTGEIDELYATPISGQPTDYAVYASTLYVWPTPNQAYPLLWELISDVTPALDYTNAASTNFWTNGGADLITAQSKLRLYRDYLSATSEDPRIANAVGQEAQAYARLKAETNRRITTGRVAPSW